jgi:hypothetical protein
LGCSAGPPFDGICAAFAFVSDAAISEGRREKRQADEAAAITAPPAAPSHNAWFSPARNIALDAFEQRLDFRYRLEPPAEILLQTPHNYSFEFAWRLRSKLTDRLGIMLRICDTVDIGVSPWNARLPVTISSTKAPNEKMSER